MSVSNPFLKKLGPIFATICLLSFGLSQMTAQEVKQPLMVQAPPQWQVKYQGDNGIQFYSVNIKGGGALLMFSRWPVPGGKDQIPALVDTLAKGFITTAKTNPDLKLQSYDYKTEPLVGDSFSGQFVTFTINDDLVQTMFMFSDGDGLWNGQFTGTKEKWIEALDILKKLKRN